MRFSDFFLNVPCAVNVETVRSHSQALKSLYDVSKWLLPVPPWYERPYDHSGLQAWEILQHELAQNISTEPMCIYVHAPFCFDKCGFCDSYSFKLGSHVNERIQEYVDRVCYELQLWSELGNLSQRPISTVHIGGGTPTFLGEAGLTQIVEHCKAQFSITSETEWALESTVQELTPVMIETMHGLGYRRLHIGIQSLEDDVRAVIGRKTRAAEGLKKIDMVKQLDWIVSVDLICGLPSQTLEGFIQGIQSLMVAGVNGFSLYELLIYSQNRRWATQHNLTQPDRHLPNFWMFLAGAELLESRGFRKNLFNHWADEHDHNIYFTFPTRDEDLLAVGTIADGIFADYHYRHPRYAHYMAASQSGLPGLEGGLRRPCDIEHLRPFTTAILAGYLPPDLVNALQTSPDGAHLIHRWISCQLVNFDSQGGLALSISGSWFAGNLLAELTQEWSEAHR